MAQKAQLITMHSDFSDKHGAIKELVARWMLRNLVPRVFGQKWRLFSPLSYLWLLVLAFECHEQHPRPYEVINEV